MLLFTLAAGPVGLMVGYDLLGLTSFLLIMFYRTHNTIKRALVTLMLNKLGDLFLLAVLAPLLLEPCLSFTSGPVFLAGLVKAAQLPFCVWLPLAMAAPTPIRALVHSSTLVVAGVLVVLKTQRLLAVPLMCIRAMTVLLAACLALVEVDFKRVVAYRTMGQMGLLFFTRRLGRVTVCLAHLVSHSFFKALMFLCVGNLLHSSNSNQHRNRVNSSRPVTLVVLRRRALALMGLGFTCGFASKDAILETLEGRALGLFYVLGLLAVCLT